ncbi:MAG: cobalt ABC transporter ATP-binding protein [Gemmatimonadetes bacterium]|nr:MAG: cobalt ABC transporter ATP-binding protein [Gemmatimonadota bacterium]
MCHELPTPMHGVLVTHKVSVRFDDARLALDRVSLSLARGERVALLGANGSGKTTCLSVLAGVLAPTTGVVWLHGEPADRSASQQRRWRTTIGMVLADVDDQLIAPIVRDDVAFGIRNAGARADAVTESAINRRVEYVLEQLGIASLADRAIHTLSLGERRRVAVAGVLVMQPEVILLDEPTANLDRRARTALRELLERASADERTVCLATHDTTFAKGWATRIVVLEQGRVLADGPTDAILNNLALLSRAELDAPRMRVG